MMSMPRQVPVPPSGVRRPQSSRIVVVLPLPLAPRKPQISPPATCRLRSSTTFRAPKLQPHLDRLTGVELRRLARKRPRLDEIDELCPRRLAVDDRRGVLGLRRDEGNRPTETRWTGIAADRHRVATMQPRQRVLGDEEAHEDIFRRQDRDDRTAGSHRLTGPRQHIRHAAADRRRDAALGEPPIRHRERGARRLDRRMLRLDFALPAERRACLRQRRLGSLHLGAGRAVIGARLVDTLRGCVAALEQRFAALQIGFGAHQCRAGIGQIGLGLRDLRRLAFRLEIGELLFGLRQLPRRLVAGGALGRVILGEERCARRDVIAARHRYGGQLPLQDRRDLDVVRLGVALPRRRRRGALLDPEEPGEAAAEDHKNPCRQPHLPRLSPVSDHPSRKGFLNTLLHRIVFSAVRDRPQGAGGTSRLISLGLRRDG